MKQAKQGEHLIRIQYAGMPKKSEFTDEPLRPPGGKTIDKTVILDEYTVTISAPQEAAERFHQWINHVIMKNDDYREMLIPMFKPTKENESIHFPLIGEEGWSISVMK